jgi:hypothetical protein
MAYSGVMKKLFLLSLLFSSTALAEDRYETNVPDVYIKNFQCINGYPKFNIVNKTDKTITQLSMHIFDGDGDPIDKRTRNLYVTPQSGKEDGMGAMDCKNLKKIGFSVIVN